MGDEFEPIRKQSAQHRRAHRGWCSLSPATDEMTMIKLSVSAFGI
jgi:hypothetical protein